MNISQPSLGFAPYNNRNLFADHYLQKVLPHEPQWQNAEGVEEAFDAVQKLWSATQHFTNKTNEAQTENDLIKPILDLLWSSGCYQVQPRIPNVDVQRQPDYAFFTAPEERTEAQGRINTMEYWRDVPALGDAKKWSASLDKERSADENPSAQICNYLYRSKVRWGILTNGQIWRLYEKEESSRGGVYYEIDLADIMLRQDRAAFRYFYLFFRRESLMPASDGISFLDSVFRGSVQYAAEVGNHLKESVYDALRELMNGFHEHAGNALDVDDPDTLRLIHQNSLIVLYRLLFLLYAEDRDLLPCEQEPYREYSLRKLQKEINGRLRVGNAYLPPMTGVWARLCNLFALIDEGFPQGGIPAYNGGLFSSAKYPRIAHAPQPQIARWQIGDRRLTQVIDLLAYERKTGDLAGSSDIDYRTLDVQHLGSIYEGLLELQPRVAASDLVEVTEDKKTVFKPKSEVAANKAKAREIAAREIYLVTNRGERKASGSYYTPKYIVDYIVENTISPLTDAAAQSVKTLRPDVDARIRELESRRKQWDAQAAQDEAAKTESRKLGIAIEEQKRRLLEPYLSLKVLDPAMGSGHFLVGAADFLSLAMATDPCVLALDDGEADPQLSFKRLVVERCLYGVDLNPLSVELAKLSLWLHTVSRDKALSFLDHHLRCGNSLIGARLEDDLMKEPPQFNAKGRRAGKNDGQLVLGLYQTLTNQHLVYLLDTLRQIMETPSGDAETEHLKDRLYREMDARREQFRAVANCWMAPFFGAPVSNAQYQNAVETLSDGDAAQQALRNQPWFQNAQHVAQEKNFFHWELEFPEVFLSPQGLKPSAERGFDAVVGNPPYFNMQTISAAYDTYFGEHQTHIYRGKADVYYYFMQLAALTTRTGGRWGFITARYFIESYYADKLWDFLNNTAQIDVLLDFRRLRVFEDAAVATAIVLSINEPPQANHAVVHIKALGTGGLDLFSISRLLANPHLVNSYPQITEVTHVEQKTLRHQPTGEETLGVYCHIGKGAASGNDDIFVVDEETAKTKNIENDLLVPVIEDDTLDAYFCEHRGNFLITTQRGIDIEKYPHAQAYLNQHKDALMARYSVQREGVQWFEIVRFNRDLFEGQAPQIYCYYRSANSKFAFSAQPYCTLTTTFVVRLKDTCSLDPLYILALLNSRYIEENHFRQFGKGMGGVVEYSSTKLDQTPVRRIDFTTPEAQRAQLVEEAKQLYATYLSTGDNAPLVGFVQEQLDATPERADVVHDALAFFAERMIVFNTQKQDETKSFLLWLERRLKHSLDAMSNKTRIRQYHDGDFASLQATLKQNARKHGVDVEARAFEELLESEWQQSMDKLAPLKARIAATDALIDAVVYRLYGLEKEEIDVVEGNSSASNSA